MRKRFILAAALCLGTAAYLQADGKTLFEKKCAMCHITQRPTPEMRKKLVAPPIMGVMHHVKEMYREEAEAVDFIVDYVLQPDRKKSVCDDEGIRRFGLMPSQRSNVSKEELEKIARYIYKHYPPAGFRHRGASGHHR